jgi:hypothetical protein
MKKETATCNTQTTTSAELCLNQLYLLKLMKQIVSLIDIFLGNNKKGTSRESRIKKPF